MGAVIICRKELAETPYYIESMGIRIYSMEELAYFLYENIYLVDKKMLGTRLWEWLRTEMHNPELADRLQKGAEAGGSLQNMVLTILRSVEFYSQEELARLTEAGKIVVIATQVMLEGSDAEVYEVGFKAVNEYNVLQAYDMTVEAAAVKLMWILGRTREFSRVRELFYRPVSHDIVSTES